MHNVGVEQINIVHLCIVTSIVPDLTCSQPVSMEGVIRVSWFYIHTGGLPLTEASVEYSYTNGPLLVTEPVSVNETNTTVVEVSNLVAGFSYTFIITAENSNGSSTISCRSILHIVGESLVNGSCSLHY